MRLATDIQPWSTGYPVAAIARRAGCCNYPTGSMAQLLNDTYRRVLRPILFRLDPELAHRIVLASLAGIPRIRRADDPPELGQTIWNIRFANPIGLAAGMDKEMRTVLAWQALGFGFVECGTITPRPQPGNPPPRLWRLPTHRALINRLGFPGAGMRVAANRLAKLRRRGIAIPLGLNLGPNRDTPPDSVPADYAALMATLGPMADFIVINLSSPNTPGLRDWQAPERLRTLIATILPERNDRSSGVAPRRCPVLIKLSPDLDSSQLAAVCDLILELGLDGIVATNTTLAREKCGVTSAYEGGLSGEPLKLRARAVIREIYRHTRGRIPIIGVGGVSSAEDAYGHIRAGASLVELYTGLVYEGPGLVGRIKKGLTALLKRDGLRSIAEAIGTGA